MKALSIRQPWAWAIIHAGKDIENRTWSTSYRGPILIHAGMGMTRDEYADFRELYDQLGCDRVPATGEWLQRGGIIGQARIIDCVSSSPSPWFFGRYGFVLTDAKPLPFRPLKGALGLFEVEPASKE